MPASVPDQRAEKPKLPVALAAVAIGIHICIAPFFLASGLVAPVWGVVVLIAVWLAGLILGLRWFRTLPWRVVPVPVVAAAVWVGLITFGNVVLGWTA